MTKTKQKCKKITTEQAKRYFKFIDGLDEWFLDCVLKAENWMKKETGVEDIEFIWVDGSIVGIGSIDKKMKIVHRV
jgi:hypothetical protein